MTTMKSTNVKKDTVACSAACQMCLLEMQAGVLVRQRQHPIRKATMLLRIEST